MRIWFAAAQKSDTYGGVFRSVSSLAEGLRRQGHDVEIIWADREDRSVPFLFAIALFKRLMRTRARPPDWIIARSSDGLLCALAARLNIVTTRVALHSHGWEEKCFEVERILPKAAISNPTTWKARCIRFPLLRATLANVRSCICGTVEEARWLKNRFPKSRVIITVVPNGCDPSEQPFWPGRDEWPLKFLAIGGFTWKKNLAYTIALFENILHSLPGARLFCVGTGPVSPRVLKLLDKLGSAVTVVECEEPVAMFSWYETCPFLISTSRYEGGRSLAILEAQNYGMVAFATSIPSTKELIVDRKNGVLISGCDLAADSARIIETCGNSILCKNIGSGAWRSAARQSWERQVKRLERILIEMR